MEVQDVPAIVEAAHQRGVLVALDNTWAAGVLFDAFAHGVDISAQALTKYIGGHSDLLLGSVTVRDKKLYERLGNNLQDCHHIVECPAVRLERELLAIHHPERLGGSSGPRNYARTFLLDTDARRRTRHAVP
jgi:cystathionine beta-lyase/cystathionine gamma-synthase